MYLSMWILAESLKDYPVETHIMSGEMCIRSVSLLFSNTTYYPHVVYIGPSEDFIQTLPGKVFCVNKNDYFIVDCASVDEVFEKLMEAVDYYLEWDLNTGTGSMRAAHCRRLWKKAPTSCALWSGS